MNTNCLEGMSCPVCGQEEEILVRARMWVSLRDDGTDAYADSLDMRGEVEYDDESDAACTACRFEATLAAFEAAGRHVSWDTFGGLSITSRGKLVFRREGVTRASYREES
jgi:hypothetical protein